VVGVDPVEMSVLVAVGVLEVDQPTGGSGPVVDGDSTAGVVGDRHGVVVVLVDATGPDVVPPAVRSEVGDPCAVRGDRRIRELRVSEEFVDVVVRASQGAMTGSPWWVMTSRAWR
jgi:hypothetical protein